MLPASLAERLILSECVSPLLRDERTQRTVYRNLSGESDIARDRDKKAVR